MKKPPKRIADAAVKATALYRDSTCAPFFVQQRFHAKMQSAFRKLVKAMECTPAEEWMVSERVAEMAARVPSRTLCPGKDY